jgi:hypothetical protein
MQQLSEIYGFPGRVTAMSRLCYVIDVIKIRASMGSGTPEEKIAGASLWNADLRSIEQIDWWLSTIIWLLLSQSRYEAALYLLLGPEMYDPRPSTVRNIFGIIRQYSEVAILGGKEMGKTYSCSAWIVADWLRDVEWTCVRVLSVTGSHARNNAFSSIQRFYDQSLVPLPGLSQKDFIGLDTKDRHASIQVLPLQPGETSNTLVGCHPVRRKQRHPQFNLESRVRIYGDEAEMLPEGAYRGFLNISKGNMGESNVRIILSANPIDVLSRLAQETEPHCGWARVNADKHHLFLAKSGLAVARLDPKFSENVLLRKNIFPGMLSWQKYEGELARSGGKGIDWWGFFRGLYDTSGTLSVLVPPAWLVNFYGELFFTPNTYTRAVKVGVGGIDMAYTTDETVLCAISYGLALGWRPVYSRDLVRFSEPKWCIQIDQFFRIGRGRTQDQFREIKSKALEVGIDLNWVAIDVTGGYGQAIHDFFSGEGHTIMPINFGNASTETKILTTDTLTCSNRFDGLHTQMHFQLAFLLQADCIKCNPNIDPEHKSLLEKGICHMKTEPSGRMGPGGNRLTKLESKDKFKSREGFSPDYSDAACCGIHLCLSRDKTKLSLIKLRAPAWQKRVSYDDATNLKPLNHDD